MKNKTLLMLLLGVTPLCAQQRASVNYRAEATGIFAHGGQAPLWLTAHRFGTTSIDENQAMLRAGLFYQQGFKHHWNVSAGLDLVGGSNLVSNFYVHQAYADVSWKVLSLSIGSKERCGFPLEKNLMLTSGWLVEGPNARPIPQVRAGINQYWSVPGLGHWLALKGHLAFGWFTDGNWQKDFVSPEHHFTKNVKYQSKSLMFRLGNKKKFPVEFEFGMLMASQYGGEQYMKQKDGTTKMTNDMPDGFKAYWDNFFPKAPGNFNAEDEGSMGTAGNVLGSWNFGLNAYLDDWKLRATYEHYFEDESQMFWEYGRWMDGQLGLEITLPKNRWISGIVYEVMSTKNQTGPFEVYDKETGERLFGGGDEYYNHGTYQAWHHHGMGMGNPLVPGPIYNKDGKIEFKSTRLHTNHLGVSGDPSDEWNWRLLASFARHWGTYPAPLNKQRKQFSSMAEVTYKPRWAAGWSATATLAIDRGNYQGNQTGGMITLRKTGGFNL